MVRKKRMMHAGIAVVLMVTLFGCGSQPNAATTASSISKSNASGAAEEVSKQMRTVKDAKGNVEIPVHPARIADISGSTEELLVLGYKPILTGNTDMQDPMVLTPMLKKELPGVSTAGWFQTDVNLEAIMAADPDLIIAGPTQEKIYDQLTKIAPTVMIPYGFNAFRERFAFVAEVFDKKDEMEDWLKGYEQRAQQIHDQITNVTQQETFAVIEATPKEIRIYARTGLADIIFHDLGLPQTPGTPEPDAWGGKVTNMEALSNFNPDHVFLLADNDQNVLRNSNIWSSLHAVKSGNVYRMSSRQNYNEAFFALGKKNVLEKISEQIVQHIGQ
ncbi:ABC transporter substrate-binding protein [Paenibacillus selenitireducens]|uniref:ABC transporter substrate-binding protein n=1 Tax=Paenibacillus selenitireducens TaxID=1324314 RepID=A0A1T2X5S1_9BACL|nr:ABC transporter substrate-binding protein [Paenibacillus selenitireducens]OPA75155.1 ABC transporter substrate-binding protein [Paenibacillus selenitireducens]